MAVTVNGQQLTEISFLTLPDTMTRTILRYFRKTELLDYLEVVSGFRRPSWTKDRIIDELLCFDNLSMLAKLGV